MDLKKLVGKVGRSEGGFTLIELLVVIAILGIIAAVVILNIAEFMGSGAEEAANTESHQVQTAVITYMQANNLTTFTGDISNTSTTGVEDYLLNPGRLQATYNIVGGKIDDATPDGDGKWADCLWDDSVPGAWSCS